MTSDELLVEVESALLNAIRQSWRQMQPNWKDIEAQAVVAAATGAVLREHPGWSDEQVAEELTRLGVLLVTPLGRVQVRVPDCSAPPVLPSSTVMQ